MPVKKKEVRKSPPSGQEPMDLSKPFLISGKRAYYSGLRNLAPSPEGRRGFWCSPIKVGYFSFYAVTNAKEEPLSKFVKKYESHLGFALFRGRMEQGEFTVKAFIPEEIPAVVFKFKLPKGVRLKAAWNSQLLGIKHNMIEHDPAPDLLDIRDGQLFCKDLFQESWCGTVGGTPAPKVHVEANTGVLEFPWATEVYVIASGGITPRESQEAFKKTRLNPNKYLNEKINHYQRVLAESTRIRVPDEDFEKCFEMAKINLEMTKLRSNFGLAFSAGLPGYAWYFTHDLFYITRGALPLGDASAIKEALRLHANQQETEDGLEHIRGEIFKDMNLDGEKIYSSEFTTFCFAAALWHYYLWTGDRDFMKEMYPHLELIVEWGHRKDIDGDLLIENYPKDFMANTGVHEGWNMEKSSIEMQSYWYITLKAAAEAAKICGEDEKAAAYLKEAETVRDLVDNFWNMEQGYYSSRVLPDGTFDDTYTGLPILALVFGLVDEAKTKRVIKTIDERLWSPAGILELDPDHPFLDCAAVRAPYSLELSRIRLLNHMVKEGMEHLKIYVRNTISEGAFAEHITLMGAPLGCDVTGWTAALFVNTIIEGIFGIQPNATNNTVRISPHLPEGWQGAQILGLKIGGNNLSYELAYHEDRITMSIATDGPPIEAKLKLPVPFGKMADAVMVDGQPTEFESYVTEFGEDQVCFNLSLDGNRRIVVPLGLKRFRVRIKAPKRIILNEKAGFHVTVQNVISPVERFVSKAVISVGGQEKECKELARAMSIAFDLSFKDKGVQRFVVPAKIFIPFTKQPFKYVFMKDINVLPPISAEVRIRNLAANVAKVDESHEIELSVKNNTDNPITAKVHMTPKKTTEPSDLDVSLMPREKKRLQAYFRAKRAGEVTLSVQISSDSYELLLTRRLKAVPKLKPIVMYKGFLEPVIRSDAEMEVVNITPYSLPLERFQEEWDKIGKYDAVIYADWQIPPLLKIMDWEAEKLRKYVRNRGKLVFITYSWLPSSIYRITPCYGVFDDILPLEFLDKKSATETIKSELLDFSEAPKCLYEVAKAKRRAKTIAKTVDGRPLVSLWKYGKGTVACVNIEHYWSARVEPEYYRWKRKEVPIKQLIKILIPSEMRTLK